MRQTKYNETNVPSLDKRVENLVKHYHECIWPGEIRTAKKLLEHLAGDREFQFGKYKGQKIGRVIIKDRWYIEWCLDNVSFFTLTPTEQLIYNELCKGITIHGSGFSVNSSGLEYIPADNSHLLVDYDLVKYEIDLYEKEVLLN